VRTFDRVVMAPRNHPVLRAARPTLAELARYPWVMPWPRSTTRRLVERALDTAGLRARVALEAGGWEIIKRYVALGAGIAVVPAYCLERGDRRRLGARPVTHLFGPDAYGIVTRRGRSLTRAALLLVRLIDPGFAAEDG
jgi:DNA-binding transcriptional LysR family regulator